MIALPPWLGHNLASSAGKKGWADDCTTDTQGRRVDANFEWHIHSSRHPSMQCGECVLIADNIRSNLPFVFPRAGGNVASRK
jgi:hypothetical protein